MKNIIISILNKLPYIRGLHTKISLYEKNSCFQPGHFYSPIMSKQEIIEKENEIWCDLALNHPVNLNTGGNIWIEKIYNKS